MTRRTISRRTFEGALTAFLIAIPCSPAMATDPAPAEEVRPIRTSREILMREDIPLPAKKQWLSPNFLLNEKAGFGYAKKVKWGDRPLVLRVRGPVMRAQKAFGLHFKLNF